MEIVRESYLQRHLSAPPSDFRNLYSEHSTGWSTGYSAKIIKRIIIVELVRLHFWIHLDVPRAEILQTS
jgi:hypothetical protein